MAALSNRDPGHLEKVRTRLGQWVTAGDEEEANLGMEDLGEGKEWEGWDEVLLAWLGWGGFSSGLHAYGMGGPEPSVAEGRGGVGGAADWRS